ncbi:Uncharacterised protein [Mycobacterium tuberculosis]|nr:Uncharacterised protein [Mycobacterium tuberculosis]
MPVPRNASRVVSDVNVGAQPTTSKISAGIPSWVAAMLRSTLARPRALSTGAATKPGSVPSSEGSPAAPAIPR